MMLNIQHPVALFPQPTGMSCWSAAATMLFGDRSVGPGGARLGSSGGLEGDFANIQRFAAAHGLVMHAPQSWTVQGLALLLQRRPLWVGGMVPGGHAYVIGGIAGDGSPDRTILTIYDPWPPRVGNRRTEPYGRWMRQYPMATLYVLHRT
jgi:hypothetical protein